MCNIILIFHQYGSSTYFHPWRNYRCIPYLSNFRSDQILYHQNSTRVMGEVGFIVGLEALLVVCLWGSVPKIDLDGVTKKNSNWVVTSVFGLKVMLGGSVFISGPCTLNLSYGTWSKTFQYHSAWHSYCLILIPLLTPCTTFLFGFHAHPPFH